MLGLGLPEWILILIILAVIFGAEKLPAVIGVIAKAINSNKNPAKIPGENDNSQ